VILRDPNKPFEMPISAETTPDHFIDNLKELRDIFPVGGRKTVPIAIEPLYDASLSTMWGMKKFADLGDFLLAVPRLGMASIELNHQVSPSMLAGLDLKSITISSIHEPCPADISVEVLKERDWLISSPDEDKRERGVESIKRSIDLAYQLHAPIVVVHCGMVSADLSSEKKLREFFEAGKTETDEYLEQKKNLIKRRAKLIGPCFDAVRKSLLVLLDYAGQFRICLGLENRYHYFDIPSLDEMGELLALAGHDQLGFIYDVGHAQTMDKLGFFPHEEWLRRYASRMIEVHLHDVVGVDDHHAPGLGEVDFDMVASYLPEDALRTFELQATNSPEQVKAGLQYLVERGCVKPN